MGYFRSSLRRQPKRRRRTRRPTSRAWSARSSAVSSVVPVRGSHLVDVTFVSEDPKFAADAVNTLVDEYVSENLEIKLRSTQGMLDWLDNELASQQKRVEDSERALAEYREKENALSLDDKQNIVLSRLNQLNDTATRARSNRVQKESLYNQVKVDRQRRTNPDAIPDHRARTPAFRPQGPSWSSCSGRRSSCSSGTATSIPRCSTSTRSCSDAQRQLDIAIAGAVQSVRNDYETARHRGTDVREEPRRRQERRDGPEPQGHRLRRDGARGQEQPRGLPVAADAREGIARLRQQPHQQRARGRPRRDPAGADHAGRPPHLADVGRDRAGARRRRRARPRLHERHDQDAGGHHAGV